MDFGLRRRRILIGACGSGSCKRTSSADHKTSQGEFHLNDRKVIPFRQRAPSDAEVEIYRQMTRRWDRALRERLFPEHHRRAQELGDPDQG